ncbi:hypothetical protein C8F04DRAFT_1263352 [Mycena alexandri]|uniref:Uncharacterized protein n=1 Tax=Mycena alexandri TaxID=1745969 RepID=A0AAD6SNR8_9AGAR|nr:hypothetical protein C8F04DRAFT_1263352 [Mycena alexandri]
MSLFVEGILASSVAFSRVPRTSVSAAFHSRLPPSGRLGLLFTTGAGPYGSLSTVLNCEVVVGAHSDVVLGLDWAAMIRETLVRDGHRLDDTFSAWDFFTFGKTLKSLLHLTPSHITRIVGNNVVPASALTTAYYIPPTSYFTLHLPFTLQSEPAFSFLGPPGFPSRWAIFYPCMVNIH